MNTKKRKMNLGILMLISFLWVYGTAMTFAATQFNVLELAKQVVMAVLSVMIVYGISEYRDRKRFPVSQNDWEWLDFWELWFYFW